MRLFKFSLPLLALMITFSSCDIFGDDEDDFRPNISPSELPVEVRDYIDDNYDDYDIEYAELEDYCDDIPAIEVELEDGPGPDVDLYFDLDGEFLFAAVEITIDDLPDAVIATIENDFPDYRIGDDDDDDDDDIERFELPDGSFQYEVELEALNGDGDDIEVVFNADGSVFCTDDDDDDDDDGDDDNSDDDNGDDDDIPESARDYISENFPGYEIEEVEKEDDLYLCDETEMYEVELEDGPGPDIDLYFTLDWEFVLAATEISEDDLPDAVIATIETDFSSYEIEDDDIEQYEFADGSLQFKVELESDNGDDVEIVFDENGGTVCRED